MVSFSLKNEVLYPACLRSYVGWLLSAMVPTKYMVEVGTAKSRCGSRTAHQSSTLVRSVRIPKAPLRLIPIL